MQNTDTTPEKAPTPDLTIVDLQNMRTVIDLAARRGAFGGSELTAVGSVFTKLDNFLNSVTPPADANKSEQTQ
jgi:hypothetical protein